LLVGLLLWSLLQAGPVQPGSFSSADCPVDRIDEQVNVRQVFDGDTVLLTDGRKIRLLGINSPELGRDDRPPEPLAREARLALAALIKQAAAVGLRYESKRQDHYKRELAHLIINGRINAQQYLLQRGLALAIAVPPNLWQQDCYQQAEDQARTHNRGVWAVDYFRALDVGRQAPGRGGFQLVSGNVVDVGKTAQWVWLDLAGGVSLRIARDDWQYFSTQNWRQWRHRDIEARGWLYQYRDRWQLRVRHPQNIKIGLRTED
jgi:endonuclease YncB( thermonuclease family)